MSDITITVQMLALQQTRIMHSTGAQVDKSIINSKPTTFSNPMWLPLSIQPLQISSNHWTNFVLSKE